jgi:thiol-disulfide isomerase/thioredoxin
MKRGVSMKNLSLLIVLLVLVVGSVGAYVFLNRDRTQSPVESMMAEDVVTEDEAMTSAEDREVIEAGSTIVANERYVSFTPQVLASSANTRRVLFFYANWCPTCRPADAEFMENATSLPDDVTLIRVNYNDPDTDQAEKDLAQKYGVTYQHTFVQIDESGNKVGVWNGGGMDELLENLQ